MANRLIVVAFHYQTNLPIDYLRTDSVAEAIKAAEEMCKREPRNSILIRPENDVADLPLIKHAIANGSSYGKMVVVDEFQSPTTKDD